MRLITPIMLLIVSTGYCDEIKKPTIVLPINPVLVQPADTVPVPPPVDPAKITVIEKIKQDEMYVVESDIELIVLTSPEGVLDCDKTKGPIRVHGKFSDGTGSLETRNYTSEFVYFFTATKQGGKTELILVPVGVSEASGIVRQVLTVSGIGPNPPPDIDPEPEPDVDPEPTPPTGIRVLLLYNEDANRQQLDVVNSTEIVQWMTDNCAKSADGRPEWRRWDRTSIERTGVDRETEVWKKLWNKVQPLVTQNNMVFVATDTKIQFVPMTTVADTKAFLQRVKEGK